MASQTTDMSSEEHMNIGDISISVDVVVRRQEIFRTPTVLNEIHATMKGTRYISQLGQ
jgi:capsular polysaccharide biosynthesis protein